MEGFIFLFFGRLVSHRCLAGPHGSLRADAVDDTLAKFLANKFPQTAAAIVESSAEAPLQASAILDALGDNRLLIDPADHIVAYKTAAGALINAKTGEAILDLNAAAFKQVRMNNALRSAIQGAMGSLTLASPDPEKRLKAAGEVVPRTHDEKALPALQAQLAKESDLRVVAALKLARGFDLRHQRKRFAARPSLGHRDAESARGPGRARPH